MAARKIVRRHAGTRVPAAPGKVQVPLQSEDLLAAVLQLQETVNELQVKHNALAGHTTNPGDVVAGTPTADAALFTPAATT